MIKEQIKQRISNAIVSLAKEGKLSKNSATFADNSMGLSRSKDASHGDFACNIALVLAKPEGKSPRDIALLIQELLKKDEGHFKKVDIAGPGFINLTLADAALCQVIPHVALRGDTFGRTSLAKPKKALIEFVSANPTGGLHLGHARGAFAGDALARLLQAAGYQVTKEFFVNDAGNQVHTLARTIHKRYRELFGESVTIEKGEYPGEIVKDIAKALKDLHGDRWLHKSEEEWLLPLTKFGVDYNLALIRRSLEAVDIEMDEWSFEHILHEGNTLEDLVNAYLARNMLYEADEALGTADKVRREDSKAALFAHMQEGGLFLRTSQFGDDEDRIIKRRDGRFVYLTADLAYHHQKFERGYDLVVDVFGGDHAGHIGRIRAGMEALGHDISKLKFMVVQMVRLIKGGQEIRFSKRAGEVIGLDDLVDEVGKDVARFVFLMRSTNAQFDLDLDLVTKHTADNPVFYVQYGHARMATILAKAKALHGIVVDAKVFSKSEQQVLTLPEERELILRMSELDEVVREAADALEPHRLIYFCQELIKIFHSYFTKYRHTEKVISDDPLKTKARLAMVFAVKQAIFNALSFLGISAPAHMEQSVESDDD